MTRPLAKLPVLILLGLAALLGACGDGPSSSPEGTLETFVDCAREKKWECCIALVDPEMVKKKKSQLGNDIVRVWKDMLRYEYKVKQVSIAGNYATIQIVEEFDMKGLDARDIRTTKDRYDSWSAVEIDGKWYLRPPGSEKVMAF